MAKPELGTKRVCPVTGRKFYDLNKNPIISPYTGMVVPVAALAGSAALSRAAARAEPVDSRPDEGEELLDPEAGDVELISLEDADQDENAAGKKAPAADEDLEIEDEIPDDDDEADTFLEEDEDEGSDVSDLIDPDIVGDEET
ncbi:TIGR02300 family protein [Terrihabitans rhizophilus]|uniref:TIGR02300 family protein n=1 Tax=Terrihabitans rhizophilus TaxID=3092662 RepID=A0ABU4RKB3_9HYPH|nr:TIGR02300 family protein [Terrihabitans sp. PJ23]MDX6804628.1 TIGR02300 family protein [Terrihabitans sp. PJ23]